jgi:hypothetical protein
MRALQSIAILLTVLVACPMLRSQDLQTISVGAIAPEDWNGIAFVTKAFGQTADFGFRIAYREGKGRILGTGPFMAGKDILTRVSEVGDHAPDNSYCRMSWKNLPVNTPVTLEWSAIDSATVLGKLTTRADAQFVFEGYFPFGGLEPTGVYSVDQTKQTLIAERAFDGEPAARAWFVVMVDRPLRSAGAYPSLPLLKGALDSSGTLVPSSTDPRSLRAAGIDFIAGPTPVHFVALVGMDRDALIHRAQELLSSATIDSTLADKATAYEKRRPSVTGLFEGAPEPIGNTLFWNTIYAPSVGSTWPTLSRVAALDWNGWLGAAWDSFFTSLLAAGEDQAQSATAIRVMLGAQTKNGLVPNIAAPDGVTPDRSQPPVAAYFVWKVYEKFLDRDLLEWAYPRLKAYHEWWLADRGDGQPRRDGDGSGLLEPGSDAGIAPSSGGRGTLQAAKFESGLDDSPMYDDVTFNAKTSTMQLHDIGLNALYALDGESLAKIAAILGKTEDSARFTRETDRMKQLIRQGLWNKDDNIYENRYEDGKFSPRLSPFNFAPMTAGIATSEQAQTMVEQHLLNPKEFWGEYVIPSIARNDPAFNDQFFVRGTIWPEMNYVVYEGMNRYGYDREALEFAQKNYNLFMADWKTNQQSDEQYYARGGSGGGNTHYHWGPLLCLIALEQYIDMNPWDGLRFGALDPPANGEYHGAVWQRHVFDVAIGPSQTALTRDGKLVFKADAGVVVRDYDSQPASLSFSLHASRNVRITASAPQSGPFQLIVDQRPVGKLQGDHGQISFAVPEGRHTVQVVSEKTH